ncbi:MAG: hypothetical protein PF518_16845 [Spirochaetaceae bacterium]|jgi:hypothetical protein|nr:hypothetical protein [Spirochaetaceae bacterium]
MTKWENLEVGQELKSSMKIRTTGDAFAEINMFNQSNLEISGNTEFILSDVPKLTSEADETHNIEL